MIDLSNPNLILFVSVFASLALAFYQAHKTGKMVDAMTNFVVSVTANNKLTTSLETQFNRLPSSAQSSMIKLIDIADPLTKTTATDLDDKTVAWLREVTDGLPLIGKTEEPVG